MLASSSSISTDFKLHWDGKQKEYNYKTGTVIANKIDFLLQEQRRKCDDHVR